MAQIEESVMGLMLFRDDLRCVDIELVVDAFVAQQQTPKDAAVYVLQPDQSPVASLLGISFN